MQDIDCVQSIDEVQGLSGEYLWILKSRSISDIVSFDVWENGPHYYPRCKFETRNVICRFRARIYSKNYVFLS